jgi:hypothetical protein
VGTSYAVTCLKGNHTFILHRTHAEALASVRGDPTRYEYVEMISCNNINLHRKLRESTKAYLARAVPFIEQQQVAEADNYAI